MKKIKEQYELCRIAYSPLKALWFTVRWAFSLPFTERRHMIFFKALEKEIDKINKKKDWNKKEVTCIMVWEASKSGFIIPPYYVEEAEKYLGVKYFG